MAPQLVRDKDGISAALLVAELAASLKAAGSSIPRRLAELSAEYGLHATSQLSWRVSDLAVIGQAMSRLRTAPPRQLLGREVSVTDLAPDNDVLILRFDGGRVVVRPSGTEPKCKAYLELVIPVAGVERGGAGTADPVDDTRLLAAVGSAERQAEAELATLAVEVTRAVGMAEPAAEPPA